jgi:hypothetical protein
MSHKRLQEYAQANGNAPNALPDDVRELRKLVVKYREQARKNKAVHSVILDALREAMEPITAPPKIRPFPKKRVGKGTPEVQHLHISDCQLGKVTSSYNLEVAERRFKTLFDKTLSLKALAEADHPVRELIIHLNGDLVENEGIFPAQQMEIQTGVLNQTLRGAKCLAGEITRIASVYDKVSCYVTPGNHGRITRDFDPESNFDTILGHFLEFLLQNVSNVTVDVSHSWYRVINVLGWGFLQVHGDSIRGWAGIPFYGITQRAMRWTDSIPEPFSYIVMGHFHTPAQIAWNSVEIFVCGSMESDSEYARKELGMGGVPSQLVFFTHPKFGVTARYPVWLEEKKPRQH